MLWVDAHRPKTFDALDVNLEATKKLQMIAKSGDFPHLLLYGPPGAGKKTRVMALLREHYGMGAGKVKMEQRTLKVTDSKEIEVGVLASHHHIEINPSDSGIYDRQVVMTLLKEIAMSVPIADSTGKRQFKVVVLNEVERLSKPAQQALRRTMELYMSTCRLILITSSLSRLIPPLKSRCLAIRIPLPSIDELKSVLINTAKKENAKLSEGLALRILKECDGNMRRSLLILEATKIHKGSLEDHTELVLPDWSLFLKEIALEIIQEQTPKRIWEVRAKIYELLGNCVPPDVIIKELALNLIKHVDSATQVKVAEIAAHYEHNLRIGSKPIVHIEAFVCEFMSTYKRYLTLLANPGR
eukprot:TRINITY_DN11480_c0_g1_i1.p1 TRINITY_DN11480_c0_g1~~TRINITY_DN11480_c0_g1_i1.p1  ORF type:complete len:373 (+),score=76.97 TRINITY_DN11480_c0_g1_i1:52-1119(+)